MLLLQNLLTALEQVWANKLRSVLTVLGVIIAVTSTIVVVAVVQGFSGYVTDFLQGIGSNAVWVFPDFPSRFDAVTARAEMTLDDVDEVDRQAPAVRKVSPLVIRQVKVGYLDRSDQVEMQGVSEDFQDIRKFYAEKGRCFGLLETENRRPVCVLGREALRKLRADDGIIGDYVTVQGKRFHVIGILERKGSFFGNSQDNVVLVPYTTAVDMFPDAERQMAFMAQAESARHVPEAKAQITDVLRRRHHLSPEQPNDFRVQTQDEFLQEFNKISLVATSVLTGIVGISLVVGGIGIMNVMLVSVTERTREIGLRKALGARRRDILAQFLTEAVVLSTSGGLIGILLGYAITYVASLHPDMVDIAVPYWAVLLGVGFSVGVGVIFGLLPAFKAAILQPIDALRYE
ncbi:MAG TPA: ABC transporter permease [Gemmataceae bacterium]|nr:ABC transporter permease [Gemmataceae bacterium]